MKQTAAKKYGFFMCICMVIGTIIGTGIFFKNEGIYGFINGNGIIGIITWILGGVIALSFGLSFMEISSSKQDSNSGIALYAKLFGGKKFGKIARNAMNNIYIPLTFFVISYYTTKATIWSFGGGQHVETIFANALGGNVIYEIVLLLFSVVYVTLILFITAFFEKAGKWIQIITVILKLIPLILIGLIGLAFFNYDPNAFSNSCLGDPEKWELVKGKNYFELILIAMPGILFAFEGFLSTTYIQKDVNKPERNVPLALIIGLTIVTIIYLLVSIGTLNLDPSGSVAKAAGNIFKSAVVNKVFERIIFIFIMISAFGTLNGYGFALLNLTRASIEDEFVFGKKLWNKITEKWNINGSTFIVTMLLSLAWGLIMAIPTILLISEKINFYDFISNSGVIMALLIYALIICFGVANRFTKKVKTKKNKYFIYTAVFSVACILIILCYNIYSYFELSIKSENNLSPILQIIFLFIILLLPLTGLLMKDKNTNLKF